MDEQVMADFERARHRAFLNDLRALLRRQSNDLIPYHEVRNRLQPEGETYRGIQEVPIREIVGSEDRFRDFDRAFLPRQTHTAGRWKNIDRAFLNDIILPPIQLYKVGNVYFVKDGNHRVSVARERGAEYIDAEVIESHIRAPLYAAMTPEQMLLQVEYAEFLRKTNLDRRRPGHDIRPTALGRYDEIWEQIQQHQAFLAESSDEEIPIQQAVEDWYDHVYLPIVTVVSEREVLRRFPKRSRADLYLWIMAHRGLLAEREGRDLSPLDSALDYVDELDRDRDPVVAIREAFRLPRRFMRRLLANPEDDMPMSALTVERTPNDAAGSESGVRSSNPGPGTPDSEPRRDE
ncbi:MAG: transcriptional regulator [Thermomicrobiales bacterium]|nr:transcriptional regulator [Thermomicrobiales bacterium]